MNNKKRNVVLSVVAMFFVALVAFVWADTNGIYHRAEDVIAGMFGGDEGGGDFSFPNNVNVAGGVNVGGDVAVVGNVSADVITANQLNADIIKSKSGGNVVIQLG